MTKTQLFYCTFLQELIVLVAFNDLVYTAQFAGGDINDTWKNRFWEMIITKAWWEPLDEGGSEPERFSKIQSFIIVI